MDQLSRNTTRTVAFSAVLALFTAQLILLLHVRSTGAPLSTGGFFLALIIASLSIMVTIYFWTQLDEAAREAHKSSWLWGGSISGGLFIGVFLGFDNGARAASDDPFLLSDTLLAISPINNTIATGAIACMIAQTIGYAIWWSFWWLAKR